MKLKLINVQVSDKLWVQLRYNLSNQLVVLLSGRLKDKLDTQLYIQLYIQLYDQLKDKL